jgi:small subunit ribosomal protein S1
MSKNNVSMDDLMSGSDIQQIKSGDNVEGTIISADKNGAWVDLGNGVSGLISRKELSNQILEVGQEITVSIIDPENDKGHATLSVRRATKEKGWEELTRIFEAKEIITVVAYDANRGGLLVELEGVRGFLPVSQLSSDNYPRVGGADKDEILTKLNSLINKPLIVKVLDVNKADNKLIFSEKEAQKDALAAKLDSISVGDVVKATVLGVIDFGAFVTVEGIEGLIHISEISWERIDDPRKYLKIGDVVDAKIIGTDKERLALSMKQLLPDPWLEEVKKIKKGDMVDGRVTRITPFGAFVQISPAVEALVHVTELSDDKNNDPETVFNINETKSFRVLEIDPENRKISLSLKDIK